MLKRMLYFCAIVAYLLCLGALTGCNSEKKSLVFVQDGTPCKVATNQQTNVHVIDKDGKDHVEKRDIGGMIVVSQPTYDSLRKSYLDKSTASSPAQSTSTLPTPASTAPATAPPPKAGPALQPIGSILQ